MRSRHLLALVCLLAGAARAQDLNVVSSVEVKDEGTTVVVSVKGSKPPNFTTFSMADPPRFVIDLSESRFQGVPEDQRIDDGVISVVKNLAYGSGATSIARVMIAFAADVEPPDVQTVGNDLVVRVTKPAGAAATAVAQQSQQADEKARQEAAAAAAAQARADADAKAAAAAAEARAQAQAAERLQGEAEQKAQADAQARAAADAEAQAAQARAEEGARAAAAARAAEIRAKAAQAEASEGGKLTEAPAESGKLGEAPAEGGKLSEAPEAAPAPAEPAMSPAEAARRAREAAAQEKAAARARAAEEARARAEAAKQAREQARADAAARKQAEAEARAAAAAEKKAKAEAEAQARADARRRAKEEAEAARVAAAEAKAAEKASRLTAEGPASKLAEIGFKQLPGASRVFVRTSAAPRFTVTDVGENVVRVELENTRVNRRNDTRFMDTSFFGSPVALITPSRRGSSYVVDIKLKQRVPYQQKVEGNVLAIDFERPQAAGAPSPAAEGVAPGEPAPGGAEPAAGEEGTVVAPEPGAEPAEPTPKP
jgi:hypothetical protein